MGIESILERALSQPKDAIRYSLGRELAAAHPDLALIETEDCSFDLRDFAKEGLCQVHQKHVPHSQTNYSEYGGQEYERLDNCWREVHWEGAAFDVITLSWMARHSDDSRTFILGPTKEAALSFFKAVCAWNNEVRGEILVYHGSGWYKSAELYEAIRGTSYSDVILQGSMLEDIRTDFERFLTMRDTYERYRIPWKRGVLFLGPPGNGKTQMVKALANSLGIPVLYVKSLKSEYGTDHDSIRKVFDRARHTAPCLLVLEDLDSLVNAGNRSFFLNELDGFAANTGIIALATANYPEKLDPAILDRPSRFDRKFNFELPATAERARYIKLWSDGLEPALQLAPEAIQDLVEKTDDFSFAYLKELFLSGMMQWIDEQDSGRDMASVLASLVGPLREQMKSALMAAEMPQQEEDDEDDSSPAALIARMRGLTR